VKQLSFQDDEFYAYIGPLSLSSRQDTEAVEIEPELFRDTSDVNITVIDQETSEVLAHSCSSTLKSGGFSNSPSLPISTFMAAAKSP
jgi:hypothetical protein